MLGFVGDARLLVGLPLWFGQGEYDHDRANGVVRLHGIVHHSPPDRFADLVDYLPCPYHLSKQARSSIRQSISLLN